MHTSRRTFCAQTATLMLAPRALWSQSTARPNVAVIDHDRILKAASGYLTEKPAPLTTLPCRRSPGSAHDYYSEPDGSGAFTAHRDALLHFSMCVPALTAAFVLTKDEHHAQQAVAHLNAWFIDDATSMTPALNFAHTTPPAKTGTPEGLVEAVHLAEVAQCVPFLANSNAMTADSVAKVKRWFAAYLDWLNSSLIAGLARDRKDHNGTSWLLQAAACAHLNTADDTSLLALRHFYKTTAIRAQIMADGTFLHEVSTPNPYRNSLFNLDMFAAICVLLSGEFESVWEYELQDGPGMRVAIARHYPYIKDRGTWPYESDANYFTNLPLRQPSLLFCARAYNRPEYVDLWKILPPDTDIPELQRTFPIRQPLLWVTRPRP